MENVYRSKAMEIIHWMMHVTAGMNLFENRYNDTPKFIVGRLPSSIICSEVNSPEIIDLTGDHFTEIENVTDSILPRAAIERAHLDVYDNTPDLEVIPYRLTSKAYALDSDAYHR